MCNFEEAENLYVLYKHYEINVTHELLTYYNTLNFTLFSL